MTETFPPASPEAIGGQVDPTDILALRLTGAFKGMFLLNNAGDQDFVSAFGLNEIQPAWLNPMQAEVTITGRRVDVELVDRGAPFVVGARLNFRWDDGSPDTNLPGFASSANRTYAAAGNYLIRVTHLPHNQILHIPVTVL
jgi:hypothetical protein